VTGSLTRLIYKAQQNNLISGLIGNLIPGGVAILQYVDDTVLCLQDYIERARNVKLLLYIYDQMLDLKINFDKSEIILVGGDNNLAVVYADIFNCQVSLFPITYLGVPISAGRLHVIDWLKLEKNWGKIRHMTGELLIYWW
jgi:hypothetical protein